MNVYHLSRLEALYLAIIIELMLNSTVIAQIQPTKVVKAPIPKYQLSTLLKDTPLKDVAITKSGHTYILSRSQLWQFRPAENTLHKVRFQKDSGLEIRAWLPETNYIWLAFDRKIFGLSLDSGQIQKVILPDQKSGKSIALLHHQRGLLWIHERGIFYLEKNASVPKRLAKTHPLTFDQTLAKSAESSYIWAIKNQFLFRWSFQKQDKPFEMMQKSFSKLYDIQYQMAHFFLQTPDSMLIVHPEGALVGAVPLSDDRELIAMDIGPRYHTFLLSDGTLESQDIRAQHSSFAKLDIVLPVGQHISIKHRGPLLALIGDNLFDIYVWASSNSSLSAHSSSPARIY